MFVVVYQENFIFEEKRSFDKGAKNENIKHYCHRSDKSYIASPLEVLSVQTVSSFPALDVLRFSIFFSLSSNNISGIFTPNLRHFQYFLCTSMTVLMVFTALSLGVAICNKGQVSPSKTEVHMQIDSDMDSKLYPPSNVRITFPPARDDTM